MTAVLVIKNWDLALALRHHRNHPLAVAIRDTLSDCGASIHPLNLPFTDDGTEKLFVVQAEVGVLNALLRDLRHLPGVAGAYIKG